MDNSTSAFGFFEALGARDSVCLQTMHAGKPHAATYGPWTMARQYTAELYNDHGADIYFTVNETDGKGRSANHITRARAIFCDYDHGLPKFGWALKPTVLVSSSHGKYQAYWVLAEPTTDLDLWAKVERQWVIGTGADDNARDVARILRVPGFVNHKYQTRVIVQIEYGDEQCVYSLDTLAKQFADVVLPVSVPVYDTAPPAEEDLPPPLMRLRRYQGWLKRQVPPPAGSGARNGWYFARAAIGVQDFAVDPESVAGELALHSATHHGAQFAYQYPLCLQLAHNAAASAKGARGVAYCQKPLEIEGL